MNNYIDNNIEFSCNPFEDIMLQQQEDKITPDRTVEFIQKLSTILLMHKNPQAMLCGLLYATNFDVGILLGVDNTITSISKQLGMSKQSFSILVDKIQLDYNITHTNTGMGKDASTIYKQSNSKKIKHEK